MADQYTAVMMDLIKGYFEWNDDYFNFLFGRKREDYIEIGKSSRNSRYRTGNDSNILFQFQFDASNNEIFTTRDVFNVFDVLGQVGGISGIVVGFFCSIFAYVADHLLILDVIENLFIIKKPIKRNIFKQQEN